jgi:hypothetical protein
MVLGPEFLVIDRVRIKCVSCGRNWTEVITMHFMRAWRRRSLGTDSWEIHSVTVKPKISNS